MGQRRAGKGRPAKGAGGEAERGKARSQKKTRVSEKSRTKPREPRCVESSSWGNIRGRAKEEGRPRDVNCGRFCAGKTCGEGSELKLLKAKRGGGCGDCRLWKGEKRRVPLIIESYAENLMRNSKR